MLGRWFGKKQDDSALLEAPGVYGERVLRHSGGWGVLRRRLEAEPGLRLLDIGFTSPANIHYLTGIGHSIYLADLVRDGCEQDWRQGQDEEGNPLWNVEGFLESSLSFPGRTFDAVLLWTALDYLPEPLVAPTVQRLHELVNPGGHVLALFHTRTQGEETAHCRFHLTPADEVEVQLAQQFPILRAFTNRSIEKLFAGWSGHRQFLAKDSVSEVLITR